MPETRSCETCRWFGPPVARVPMDIALPDSVGSCRYLQPKMTEAGFAVWPNVERADWCRRYEKIPQEPVCADHPDRKASGSLLMGFHACWECLAKAWDKDTAEGFLRDWRKRRFEGGAK